MWEYHCEAHNGPMSQDELDTLGLERWELVAVWIAGTETHYVFKRLTRVSRHE